MSSEVSIPLKLPMRISLCVAKDIPTRLGNAMERLSCVLFVQVERHLGLSPRCLIVNMRSIGEYTKRALNESLDDYYYFSLAFAF